MAEPARKPPRRRRWPDPFEWTVIVLWVALLVVLAFLLLSGADCQMVGRRAMVCEVV